MANQDLQSVAVQAAHGTRKATPVADKQLKRADKVCFCILHPALLNNTGAQLVEFRAAKGLTFAEYSIASVVVGFETRIYWAFGALSFRLSQWHCQVVNEGQIDAGKELWSHAVWIWHKIEGRLQNSS